jgi:hypothetical protein
MKTNFKFKMVLAAVGQCAPVAATAAGELTFNHSRREEEVKL